MQLLVDLERGRLRHLRRRIIVDENKDKYRSVRRVLIKQQTVADSTLTPAEKRRRIFLLQQGELEELIVRESEATSAFHCALLEETAKHLPLDVERLCADVTRLVQVRDAHYQAQVDLIKAAQALLS